MTPEQMKELADRLRKSRSDTTRNPARLVRQTDADAAADLIRQMAESPAPHDDTALLRQALDALENRCGTNAEERAQLIPALRARLDGAPQSTAWRSIDEPLNYLTKGEDGQQFLNSVTMPKHAKQWAYQAPQPDDTALPSRHPGPSGSRTTTRTTCHETQDR